MAGIITKCDSYFITKCDVYYRLWQYNVYTWIWLIQMAWRKSYFDYIFLRKSGKRLFNSHFLEKQNKMKYCSQNALPNALFGISVSFLIDKRYPSMTNGKIRFFGQNTFGQITTNLRVGPWSQSFIKENRCNAFHGTLFVIFGRR